MTGNRARGWALGLALVVTAACQGTDPSGAAVPTTVVERTDDFSREMAADGHLAAVEATPITSPPDAKMPMKIAWIAEDGVTVKEGDTVVRFDESSFERKLADGRDDIRSAESQMAKEKLIASSNRRKRQRTAEVAETEVDVAERFEIKDQDILSRVDMADQAIDLEMAKARVDHATKVSGIEGSVASGKVAVHRIAREQAEREIERTSEALEKLTTVAPHDGILALEKNWRGESARVGDTVWPGQPLAEIPIVTAMEAEVFVLEASAGGLKEGLPAIVTIDAHPGVEYAAKVKRVDTLAKPRHPEVPVQYFGVTLELEKTDVSTMRVGQRVQAIIRAQHGEALVLPRQAVFEVEGKHVVYRGSGRDFEPVEVELGASTAGRVQIVDGVEAGDRVALRDPTKPADAPGSEDHSDEKGGPATP